MLDTAIKEAESFSFGDYNTVFSIALSRREGSRWGLGAFQRKNYRGLSWDEAVQEATKKLKPDVLNLLQNSRDFSYAKSSDVPANKPDSWTLSHDPSLYISSKGIQAVVIGFYRYVGGSRSALRATIYVEPNNIDQKTINQQNEFTSVAHIDFAQGTLNTEEVLSRINKNFVLRQRVFYNLPVKKDDYPYITLWGKSEELAKSEVWTGEKRLFGNYQLYNDLAWVSAFGGNAKIPPVYR